MMAPFDDNKMKPIPGIGHFPYKEPISTGTTLIALQYDGGVVVGTDSRTSSGSFISSRVTDKILPITVLSIHLTPFEGFTWTKMNETTGKFQSTTEALKVDPLGMGIIFFLMGILIVQTIGMLIHRLNTLVEALHELSEMNEHQLYDTSNFNSYKTVLDEARQMIDTVSYDRAHGADGYIRTGLAESKAQRNVLYKLQTEDDP